MMSTALFFVIYFVLFCLGLATLLATIRLFRGPTAQDRVMALDAMYLCAMLMLLTLGMRFGTIIYFELAMLIALIGFVGSVAMAKFLLRGEVIE